MIIKFFLLIIIMSIIVVVVLTRSRAKLQKKLETLMGNILKSVNNHIPPSPKSTEKLF